MDSRKPDIIFYPPTDTRLLAPRPILMIFLRMWGSVAHQKSSREKVISENLGVNVRVLPGQDGVFQVGALGNRFCNVGIYQIRI